MARITDTCAEYKRVIWRFIVSDGVSNKMAVDGMCGKVSPRREVHSEYLSVLLQEEKRNQGHR